VQLCAGLNESRRDFSEAIIAKKYIVIPQYFLSIIIDVYVSRYYQHIRRFDILDTFYVLIEC